MVGVSVVDTFGVRLVLLQSENESGLGTVGKEQARAT